MRDFVSFALDEICWSKGNSRQDSELRKTFIPNERVLILALPRRQGRVACGWTDETRKVLTAFFVWHKRHIHDSRNYISTGLGWVRLKRPKYRPSF